MAWSTYDLFAASVSKVGSGTDTFPVKVGLFNGATPGSKNSNSIGVAAHVPTVTYPKVLMFEGTPEY